MNIYTQPQVQMLIVIYCFIFLIGVMVEIGVGWGHMNLEKIAQHLTYGLKKEIMKLKLNVEIYIVMKVNGQIHY